MAAHRLGVVAPLMGAMGANSCVSWMRDNATILKASVRSTAIYGGNHRNAVKLL